MESWVAYTLLATLLYGLLHFLYKVAAERGHGGDGLVSVVGLSVALLAMATLWATAPSLPSAFTVPLLVYALFNGAFFALGSLTNYGALKRAPAATVFSLNRLNTLGVMAIGFAFFQETPRLVQALGIVAGLGVLGTIAFEQRGTARGGGRPGGILLALASALFTALSMTVGKLLADSPENRIAYIAASYALVYLFTVGRNVAAGRRAGGERVRLDAETVLFGAAIGALNFAGYFLLLQAFGSGPISLSQAIFGSSIVVPVLLSRWIYGERLTPPRLAAMGLAILSVVLIGWK